MTRWETARCDLLGGSHERDNCVQFALDCRAKVAIPAAAEAVPLSSEETGKLLELSRLVNSVYVTASVVMGEAARTGEPSGLHRAIFSCFHGEGRGRTCKGSHTEEFGNDTENRPFGCFGGYACV